MQGLISDSNCSYHCSVVTVVGSYSAPLPYKNIVSLVHQPVSNMVLTATGQLLLPLVSLELLFHYTFNYIKFLIFTRQINLDWSFLELWLHQQLSLYVYSLKFFHDQFLTKDNTRVYALCILVLIG